MRDMSKLAEQLGALTLMEAAQLKTMLEKQWATPSPSKPKQDSNEGKVCDAVVRRLEEREGSSRKNLRSPEAEGHKFPIDLVFNLGEQLFALEHTRIEPFDGHIEMEAQTKKLFAPIKDALENALGTDAYYELSLPVHALRKRKEKEIPPIQTAIIEWVKATAPTIEKRPYPDYRGNGLTAVRVAGVPFDLSLIRFEPPLGKQHFAIRHLVDNLKEKRQARIQKAIDDKFPKLFGWKEQEKAKSILVLEQNDMQLSSPGLIAETYIPLAKDRADRPDETYVLVAFPDSDWWLMPILIGDKTHDEIVRSGETSYWEFDPAKLQQLTNR
jgi:hypothetical protein